MNIRLLTISTVGLLASLTGCVERRVEYVPVYQGQPQTQAAYAPTQPGPAAPSPDSPGPAVSAQAPAPPAEAPLTAPSPPPVVYAPYAPDYYVWDGYEYVGVSNGQYVYWAGGAWLVAPPFILGRFHGWVRFHPDWRRRAIPYRRHFR